MVRLNKRYGFLITEEERKDLTQKHNRAMALQHSIFTSEQSIQKKYTLTETIQDSNGTPITRLRTESDEYKAFSQEIADYHNSQEYKDLSTELAEVEAYIYNLQKSIDKRFSKQFTSKEDLYSKAQELIDSLSLELTPRQQASYMVAGDDLANPNDFITDKKVTVNFDNIKRLERWKTCYSFFLDNLDLQNMLILCKENRWSTKPIINAVKEKTDTYYKRPSRTPKKQEAEQTNYDIVVANDDTGFYLQPTSTAISLINEGFTYAPTQKELDEGINTFAELARRNNAISHSRKVQGAIQGNIGELVSESKDTKIRVQFSDLSKLVANQKNSKKMIDFIAGKISQQAFIGNENKLIREIISFPLQDLVDKGIYTNIRSARAGYERIVEALTKISVEGTIKKGKNREEQNSLVVPFVSRHLKGGICRVRINPDLNWSILINYWTALPDFSFALPNRAYDLNRYIFNQARQNLNEIEKQGGFTISLRAVQKVLNLPDEKKTSHPQQDIKDAIENAIEEIEKRSKSQDYTITLYCNGKPYESEKINITEYLNKGYLDIRLKGKYAERFKALAETK